MWRDILVIGGFVLAFLMYFGLTPRQLSTYAKTAKGEITKRSRFQKAFLFLMIAITALFIFAVVSIFGTTRLVDSLWLIIMFIYMWGVILIETWKLKLSERGEKVAKVLRAVGYIAFLSLMITSIALSNMLLWEKFAYPLIGAGIGGGIIVLNNYLGKNRQDRSPSKGGDK